MLLQQQSVQGLDGRHGQCHRISHNGQGANREAAARQAQGPTRSQRQPARWKNQLALAQKMSSSAEVFRRETIPELETWPRLRPGGGEQKGPLCPPHSHPAARVGTPKTLEYSEEHPGCPAEPPLSVPFPAPPEQHGAAMDPTAPPLPLTPRHSPAPWGEDTSLSSRTSSI